LTVGEYNLTHLTLKEVPSGVEEIYYTVLFFRIEAMLGQSLSLYIREGDQNREMGDG
jgi:hypothetical protein